MSWFLVILFLSLTFCSVSEARHHKKVPSAVVVGTVYCDTCFQNDFSFGSHFISGASVGIECKDGKSKPRFKSQVKTNEHGEFKVKLPFSVSKNAKRIKGCSLKLISSNDPYCAVASTTTSSSLNLKSTNQKQHIFSTGFFSFKPIKKPKLCNQKPKFSDKKLFFPTIPFFPPLVPNPFQPPLVPNPFQPPLIPNPFQPPPLIPNPFQPPPPLIPNPFQPPSPPPLFPNPFQPPSPPPLFPNPFQPPSPPPLIPNPFQPPPSTPPPLIPNPFQPPPSTPTPSFPPFFPFPPIPGLAKPPPPPPPPPPFFPFPFPPLFPPPHSPGTPPGSSIKGTSSPSLNRK